MSRIVRDASLESRTARSRLKPRGRPYYRALEPGLLHLGYRKPLAGAGKWLARHYVGDGTYRLHKIGIADDLGDPDGRIILSFKQAQAAARKLMVEAAGGGTGTIGEAMTAYLAHLEADGRSPDSITKTRHIIDAHVLPTLDKVELAKLTPEMLKRWCADLAKRAPRLRTRKGKPQAVRHGHRLAPGSARRIWVTLRAALQHAFDNDKATSDQAWRKLRPFRAADAVRARYLSMAEARRLINAAAPEFRPLLQGALLTGARYGQLIRLVVSDFNADVGTLRLTSRKGRGHEKTHHAHLSEEGQTFFTRMCAGKAGSDLIFTHADGRPWERAHQLLPLKAASTRAGIKPAVNFHMTRHTFASHSVMAGMPLLVVAKTLGHGDTGLIERVYGHLAPSYIASAVREHAPRYGIAGDNVRPLRTKR